MPMACRRKERTMTILVKELMRSRMAGANVRMVSTITMLIRFLLPWLPTSEPKRSDFAGAGGLAAAALAWLDLA